MKKIVLYAKLGYGTAGKEDQKYYLATQQLIWETINATGLYQTEYYETLAGKKINIANLGWTTDKENRINIDSEINEIKTAVNNYYITPSFCSSQNKLEIEIGKSEEYIDSNNVLSLYQVSCQEGLECSKDGNKLTVKAVKDIGQKNITFTKEAIGAENILYRAGDEQALIIANGIIQEVTCTFGINNFQNVQTSDSKIVYISIIGAIGGLLTYLLSFIIYKTKKI